MKKIMVGLFMIFFIAGCSKVSQIRSNYTFAADKYDNNTDRVGINMDPIPPMIQINCGNMTVILNYPNETIKMTLKDVCDIIKTEGDLSLTVNPQSQAPSDSS